MKLPEAELIKEEFVLRNLLLPKDTKLTRIALIRWFALTIGLISPNETRDSLLKVLDALFYYQYKKNFDPRAEDIIEHIKVNEKTVRYHLLQLQKKGLVERIKGNYRFSSSPFGEERDVADALAYKYRTSSELIFEKVKEAVNLIKEK